HLRQGETYSCQAHQDERSQRVEGQRPTELLAVKARPAGRLEARNDEAFCGEPVSPRERASLRMTRGPFPTCGAVANHCACGTDFQDLHKPCGILWMEEHISNGVKRPDFFRSVLD